MPDAADLAMLRKSTFENDLRAFDRTALLCS
jgi:hypothetical protein